MKKLIYFFFASILAGTLNAQENVLPAPAQKQPILITNATVHVGNGQVLEKASILIKDGKIAEVGLNITAPAGSQIINAENKHVYPGIDSSYN